MYRDSSINELFFDVKFLKSTESLHMLSFLIRILDKNQAQNSESQYHEDDSLGN